MDAGRSAGQITTQSFVWPKKAALHVNTDAVGGRIDVEVIGEDGKKLTIQTSGATGNQLDATVLSQSNARILAGKRVRLRFRIREASLYAWWLK